MQIEESSLVKVCFVALHDFRLFPRAFNEMETLANNGFAVEALGLDKNKKMSLIGKRGKVQLIRVRPKLWIDVGALNIFDFLLAFLALFPKSIRRRADVYHCYDFVSLAIGFLNKILRNKILVYDAYENWPELIANSPNFQRISQLVWIITSLFERFIVRYCDFVLTIDSENGMLLKRFKRYNRNVQVLLNVPKLHFKRSEGESHKLMEKYKHHRLVFYLGSISNEKGLLKSIEAINIVRKKIPNVKLLIAGAPSLPHQNEIDKKEALEYIKSQNLERNVEFLGWVPYSNLLNYLCLGKVGLVLYQPNSWLIKQSRASSKLFMYMLASLPVVVSNFAIKEIVETEKCGVAVDPTNPNKIANAIVNLLQNPLKAQKMGESGRKAVEDKYNWEIIERKLIISYQTAINS